MDKQELINKVRQIEEQASDILVEFPKNLTHIRTEIDLKGGIEPLEDEKTPVVDPDDTVSRPRH